MPVEINQTSLSSEIRAATKCRDNHLWYMERMVATTLGSYFSREVNPLRPTPENHNYQYLTRVIPALAFDNPRVKVNSIGWVDEPGAAALTMALNQWIVRTHVREPLQRIAIDSIFSYGVSMVCMGDEPSSVATASGLTPMRPVLRRIDPRRFIIDPMCHDVGSARYMGHMWVADRDKLMSMPNIDSKMVETLPTDDHRQNNDQTFDKRWQDLNRNDVLCYDMWFPELEAPDSPGAEDGFHGAIVTLASIGDNEVQIISKQPRPYFGHRNGPYTMFGAYFLPGQIYPLSPLVAIAEQVEELNLHAVAMTQMMRQYKRVGVALAANQNDAQELRNIPNGNVAVVTSDKPIEELELGGATEAMYRQVDALRSRVDRNSGLNQPNQGSATNATATEVGVMQEALDARIAFQKQQFVAQTAATMEKVAYLMFMSHEYVENVSPDQMFIGGLHDNQQEGDFYSHAFNIEPMSMERTSGPLLQKRAIDAVNLALTAAPVVTQLPQFNWQALFKNLGDALNNPALADFLPTAQPGMMGAPLMMPGQQPQGYVQPPQAEDDVSVGQMQGNAVAEPQNAMENTYANV